MDYPQHPFHNSTINLANGIFSIGSIKISTADRQKCPVCGHATGDCTGETGPPKSIAGFNQIESLKKTQSLLVEEDISEERQITPFNKIRVVIHRKGSYISLDEAKKLGLL
jgi:hypothetical protein